MLLPAHIPSHHGHAPVECFGKRMRTYHPTVDMCRKNVSMRERLQSYNPQAACRAAGRERGRADRRCSHRNQLPERVSFESAYATMKLRGDVSYLVQVND